MLQDAVSAKIPENGGFWSGTFERAPEPVTLAGETPRSYSAVLSSTTEGVELLGREAFVREGLRMHLSGPLRDLVSVATGADGLDYMTLDAPEGWCPGSADLSMDLVIEAARSDVAIDLTMAQAFDLHDLGEAIPSITRLRFDALAEASGLQALAQMHQLRWLWAPSIDERVDLSHLLHLEDVTLSGPGLLSALHAPSLRRASLGLEQCDAEFTVPPTVETFSLSGPRLVAAQLNEARSLRELWLSGVTEVDLTGLNPSMPLEVFSLMEASRLRGVSDLLQSSRLREFQLIRVKSVEQVDAIETAEIDWLYVEGCPDFDEATASKLATKNWHIKPHRPRGTRASALSMSRMDDGSYEVVFDDWSIILDLFGISYDQPSPIDSGDIEMALRWTLQNELTDEAIRNDRFDSEGDTVRVLVPTRQEASAVKRAGNNMLRTTQSLRTALDAAATAHQSGQLRNNAPAGSPPEPDAEIG